jgi:hypothetical protein
MGEGFFVFDHQKFEQEARMKKFDTQIMRTYRQAGFILAGQPGFSQHCPVPVCTGRMIAF